MKNHLVKSIDEVCIYCNKKFKGKKKKFDSEHEYMSLTCECGKETIIKI